MVFSFIKWKPTIMDQFYRNNNQQQKAILWIVFISILQPNPYNDLATFRNQRVLTNRRNSPSAQTYKIEHPQLQTAGFQNKNKVPWWIPIRPWLSSKLFPGDFSKLLSLLIWSTPCVFIRYFIFLREISHWQI